ncbi:MAG: DUF512 domain-containing protein, partial [Thermoleophilia bacterium]
MSWPAAGPPAGQGLLVDEADGPAARAGVRPGDRIVAIGGRPPEDVLDLVLAAADGRFSLELERGGRRVAAHVVLGRGDEHGISLHDGLGVPIRRCANDCTFCFVDQLPPGLRPSLYVRDDDYRLSFLQGTFITLTNVDDHDLERIAAQRLSPLYVSLHAWDDDVRVGLMGAGTAGAPARLAFLAGHGIELHVQVVLCPGVNDGAVLRETVEQLASLAGGPTGAPADGGPAGPDAAGYGGASARGGVVDVGVVPVSLARESRGLRRVTAADAAAAVTLVAELQSAAAARLGRRFVHAADELYLQSGVLPPSGDAPSQYENGVGICAALLADADAVVLETVPAGARLALLGGAAAKPVLAAAAESLAARGAAVRPFIVANRLFGPRVTVTG